MLKAQNTLSIKTHYLNVNLMMIELNVGGHLVYFCNHGILICSQFSINIC